MSLSWSCPDLALIIAWCFIALGFTSTTRAQPIWCSTKCHSACIYPCPHQPTPRARSEIMRGLHPAIAPRGENTVQLAHMSCMYRAVHQIFWIHVQCPKYPKCTKNVTYSSDWKSTAKAFQCERIRTNLKIVCFIESREWSEKVGTISYLSKNRKNAKNRMSVTKCTLQLLFSHK